MVKRHLAVVEGEGADNAGEGADVTVVTQERH